MGPNEVVITGMGMITPLGATFAECARAWREGRSAVRQPLPELNGTPLEGIGIPTLPDIKAAERLGSRRMLKYMSDAAVLGCLAGREALENASVRARFSPERVGLYAGTGLATANIDEVKAMVEASIDKGGQFSCRLLGKQGLAATNPLLSFKILANMPPCLISIIECIKGPNLVFTPWEGQTGAALVEAWKAVASGEVDCALVGAADNAAHPATFVYLSHAGLLGDKEYPASGAAYFIFERRETAERDGKRIHGEIKHISLAASNGGVVDPLSERLGRTFAAAPAILLGFGCTQGKRELSICGVDRQRLEVRLEFSV